jgi:hypothetical protein
MLHSEPPNHATRVTIFVARGRERTLTLYGDRAILELRASPDTNYRIEASQDLSLDSWTPPTAGKTDNAGVFHASDESAPEMRR